MKPIAASFCSQTVSSVSSHDWSNDFEASFHFPTMLHQLGRQHIPSIFLSSLVCVIAVSLFFHVPSHLHVSISSSHHVFSLSQPFSFWHRCKASIIEWCMGVCVSGIEGLGTPPAPPAEEALTAEHRGLIPPSLPLSSYAQFHISTDLLPPPLTPSPSFVFSLVFYLFPVVLHISAQPLDVPNICSHFYILFVCFLPFLFYSLSSFSLPLTLFKYFHYLSLIIHCSARAGHTQCLLTVTAMSIISFLFDASEVSPSSPFFFLSEK